MMLRVVSFFVVASLAVLLPFSAEAATGGYHAAKSAAEKRLAEIFTQAENDSEMTGYLLKIPGFDVGDKGYSLLFTDALMTAWEDTQTRMLKQDCNGEYREDMVCGINGNPVTCSQDISDKGYLYKTMHEDAQSALISYVWPNQPEGMSIPSYRLIKDAAGWKLDGVDCGAELQFNME